MCIPLMITHLKMELSPNYYDLGVLLTSARVNRPV
jgi:hypothetical protein